MRSRVPVFVLVCCIVIASCVSVLVSSVFFAANLFPYSSKGDTSFSAGRKAEEIQSLVDNYFIGEYDETEMGDLVASAMVEATGDRWSYYVPASEYSDYEENSTNSYCGIGITVEHSDFQTGYRIKEVSRGGPAWKAGILPGDVLHSVEGKSTSGMTMDEISALVRGEKGTFVTLTILREGEIIPFEIIRSDIKLDVCSSKIFYEKIGYVKLENFSKNSSTQALNEINSVISDGAEALVIDLRFNPGGRKDELCDLLDYFLPECGVFCSVDYDGNEETVLSDASCNDIPTVVIVNSNSYSAAEYMAGVLQEYERAVVVGEKTVGKGRFQVAFDLEDGSVLNLSIGNYFLPSGKSLEGIGVTPDIPVSVDEKTLVGIYSGTIADSDDPQLQAAIEAARELCSAENS